MISWILIALALLSILLNLWQWYAGGRFRFGATDRQSFAPPLSILRPLKGCDSETERCLKSWFEQEYPGATELLFGVADENDPVCEVVRRLIARHPGQHAELRICKPLLGANAKVSSLCYLSRSARHEYIVISDQDVLVPSNFLSALVQPLASKQVGLVNCFYILAGPQNLAMWLEAVAVNSDFWSQVLQGNMLKPMDFALGAVMALPKPKLDEIGGFESLLDYLADDYQLGHRIAKTGGRLEICPLPVECRADPQKPLAVFKHQVRWGRTIRVCQPLPYFCSILSNATLWPLLALWSGRSAAFPLLLVALVLRMLTASSSYQRLTKETSIKAGLLAPLKDIFQVGVWGLAFVGNEVTWRDQRFRVDKGGKLTRLA